VDDRAIEVRSPAEAKRIFPVASVSRLAPGAHPASCTMGAGGKSRPGRDADHLPHLVPRSRIIMSYTPLHPSAFMACSGTALAFSLWSGFVSEEAPLESCGKHGNKPSSFINGA
jgi:hypothetical protein